MNNFAPRCYSIARMARINPEDHIKTLQRGLLTLGAQFLARCCHGCSGAGEYQQNYTAGHGRYYQGDGVCSWCDGSGLIQGNGPAPISVINQVLGAAGVENTYA